MNALYSLTEMTGRTSGHDRTAVIGTVEMRLRTFWIAVVALVPGALIAAIFFPLLNYYSFLWIAVSEAAAFYFIEGRSRDGLRLRNYRALYDKRKAMTGQFYLCGQLIDPGNETFGAIQSIAGPLPGKSRASFADSLPERSEHFEDF